MPAAFWAFGSLAEGCDSRPPYRRCGRPAESDSGAIRGLGILVEALGLQGLEAGEAGPGFIRSPNQGP